jgi:N-acyl-D-aspartate/D-glutamate deacylase
LEGTGLSINVTGLVGHGTLRLTAMGPADGRPNPDQMTRMKSLLSQSMEAAVHKMSGMTARRLGLKDTGVLRKGFKADAVLFDPLTFGDMATYDHPRRFPQGLLATIVNGEVVIDGEKHTGAKPGKFFRKGNRV